MTKPVILTGLRANNDLHIGNYLGALLPIVDLAKQKAGQYQINLFVPDLHSFTTPIDHGALPQGIMNNLRLFAAAGLPLDNPDVHIYRQSYIPAHSELTWILDCFTGFGEMRRMTQFKDKSRQLMDDPQVQAEDIYEYKRTGVHSNSTTVGLFNYPVLMAADILLYGAEYVPVGDDQTQHLEFTRDIAKRLNARFGDLFVVPKPVKEQHEFFGNDQGLRIKDLADPTKKMSKSSDSDKGVIFMTDTLETARQKIMAATTDSLRSIKPDPVNQPGITNLLDILKLLVHEPVSYHIDDPSDYLALKKAAADSVVSFLENFQTKLAAVDDAAIATKLQASEAQMNDQANRTLLKVQQAVGLRQKS